MSDYSEKGAGGLKASTAESNQELLCWWPYSKATLNKCYLILSSFETNKSKFQCKPIWLWKCNQQGLWYILLNPFRNELQREMQQTMATSTLCNNLQRSSYFMLDCFGDHPRIYPVMPKVPVGVFYEFRSVSYQKTCLSLNKLTMMTCRIDKWHVKPQRTTCDQLGGFKYRRNSNCWT